jgi:hypothetical protein
MSGERIIEFPLDVVENNNPRPIDYSKMTDMVEDRGIIDQNGNFEY